MSTKTIVFDLDDTIVKEIDYLKSVFQEIANYLDSNDLSLYNTMLEWYQNKEDVFQNLEKQFVKAEKQVLLKMYRNHFPNFNPNSEAKQILIDFKKQGYFLGLITDGYSITQRNKLKALDIEDLFDLIVISEEFGSEKPNLKNFEIFHQFRTEEYYYIGDNISKDFLTPNQLSWKSICILDDGYNIHKQNFDIERVYLPSQTVQKLSELIKIIK